MSPVILSVPLKLPSSTATTPPPTRNECTHDRREHANESSKQGYRYCTCIGLKLAAAC